jgi:GNAT superfamily N-acetyltransferase
VIRIDSLRSRADADAFRRLNEAWISALFTMEAKDRESLADPVGRYVAPGGDVLLARDEAAGRVVGCVALEPAGDGVFELSKMTVDAAARGHGLGHRLVGAAIERARELGATSLFLASNARLAPAIHCYEAAGFVHVPREQLAPVPFERADVFMTLPLDVPLSCAR